MMAVESKGSGVLEGEDNNTLEYKVIDQARKTIDFLAADLTDYGLKTFWMYPNAGQPTNPATGKEQPEVSTQSQIENEFYLVEASQADGTLTVTDKQTGAVFTGLNRFVDGGDVGDLYTYCPPTHDTLISKPVEPPKIELVSAGPVRSIMRISGSWSLPGACSATRAERSAQMTTCPIIS